MIVSYCRLRDGVVGAHVRRVCCRGADAWMIEAAVQLSKRRQSARKWHRHHCSYCDFSARYATDLRRHVNTGVHRAYECRERGCTFSSTHEQALYAYRRYTHCAMNVARCDACFFCLPAGKRAAMGVHATSHSDAREVSCRFHCGAMFKTKDNERGHAMNRCRHRQSPPLCASKFILLLTESPPCGPLHPRQQYTTVRDSTRRDSHQRSATSSRA